MGRLFDTVNKPRVDVRAHCGQKSRALNTPELPSSKACTYDGQPIAHLVFINESVIHGIHYNLKMTATKANTAIYPNHVRRLQIRCMIHYWRCALTPRVFDRKRFDARQKRKTKTKETNRKEEEKIIIKENEKSETEKWEVQEWTTGVTNNEAEICRRLWLLPFK